MQTAGVNHCTVGIPVSAVKVTKASMVLCINFIDLLLKYHDVYVYMMCTFVLQVLKVLVIAL